MEVVRAKVTVLSLSTLLVLVGHGTAQDRKPDAPPDKTRSGQPAMTRDQAYQSVYKTLGRFEAVMRQQPENRAALARSHKELAEGLVALKYSVPPPAGDHPPSNLQAVVGGLAAVPSGPVTPSARPSPPDEVERRRQATEDKSHRPTPPLTRPGEQGGKDGRPKSLAGASEAWVRKQNAEVEKAVAEVGRLIAQPEVDAKSLRDAAAKLRAALDRLGDPTAEAGPTTPKAPAEGHKAG